MEKIAEMVFAILVANPGEFQSALLAEFLRRFTTDEGRKFLATTAIGAVIDGIELVKVRDGLLAQLEVVRKYIQNILDQLEQVKKLADLLEQATNQDERSENHPFGDSKKTVLISAKGIESDTRNVLNHVMALISASELQPTPDNLRVLTAVLQPAIKLAEAGATFNAWRINAELRGLVMRMAAAVVSSAGVSDKTLEQSNALLEKFNVAFMRHDELSSMGPDRLQNQYGQANVQVEYSDRLGAAHSYVVLRPGLLDLRNGRLVSTLKVMTGYAKW